MKQFLFRCFLCVTLLMFSATSSAEQYAIGLSPYQKVKDAEAQVKSVLPFLTAKLEPGDTAILFDAWHIQTLGHFVVPNKSAYRHPKAKLQANARVVRNLLAFAKQAKIPQGKSEPSLTEAIRWPQTLRFVGENYPAATESDLILLGNPLYDDPKDKDFTMSKGRIPGDGHLTHSRSATPYGIKGQDTLMTNWRVHLGFADMDWKRNENHGFHVQRFWTLYIENQGGKLATFTSDLSTLFQRVKSHSAIPQHDYVLEHSKKLEMILVRPPVVKRQLPIYERPLSTVPMNAGVLRQARNVEIGITWMCEACDVDLYARKDIRAEPLSFRQTQTTEGTYFKDWLTSPRLSNGQETIAYHVPINLERLFLATNFYSGNSQQGITGEVRISVEGQTYAKAFHISAKEGNEGEHWKETLDSGKAPSAHWLVINPLEVIALTADTPILSKK